MADTQYADAVAIFFNSLTDAEAAAENNGLSKDEIIAEYELRIMALNEETD